MLVGSNNSNDNITFERNKELQNMYEVAVRSQPHHCVISREKSVRRRLKVVMTV